MSNTRLGFHARFPEGPTDADVAAAHDEAAAAVGMVLFGVDQDLHGTTRRYGEAGGIALPFAFTLQPPCQLCMLGDYGRETQPYAPTRIADMFTRTCAALDADLGRSDLGLGHSFVQESEVNGGLEFIDWYQFLGPRLVECLGRERVLSSQAFQITELEGGAIVMLLAPDPWSEDLYRKRVADHLGIVLRPLSGRNPATGEPVVIAWR